MFERAVRGRRIEQCPASRAVGLGWVASTGPGANNGSLTLWIDDVQQQSLTGIDNDTRRVTQVDLGAVSGVDRTTVGTTYFDEVEIRQSSYIGGTALTLADFGIVTAGNWNQNELDAMLAAAMLTGQAFQSQYGGGDSPADKFKGVMYLTGRDTIEIVRSTQSGYECTTDNNNVSGTQEETITCDASVIGMCSAGWERLVLMV